MGFAGVVNVGREDFVCLAICEDGEKACDEARDHEVGAKSLGEDAVIGGRDHGEYWSVFDHLYIAGVVDVIYHSLNQLFINYLCGLITQYLMQHSSRMGDILIKKRIKG